MHAVSLQPQCHDERQLKLVYVTINGETTVNSMQGYNIFLLIFNLATRLDVRMYVIF